MKRWYVIYTKPRSESIAEANLQRQGYETYLPMLRRSHERSSKRGPAVEPLFPRYLFARLDVESQSISPIRSTCGVSTIVMFGSRLGYVAAEVIEILRQGSETQSGLRRSPRVDFQKGEPVKVTSGPFEGLHGVFQVPTGDERVIILLEMLGKCSSVSLRCHDVARGEVRL